MWRERSSLSQLPEVPPSSGCFKPAAAAHERVSRVSLSHLDTLPIVQQLYIPVAFFYASRIDTEVLAVSLSRTLARYPLMAGAWRQQKRRCQLSQVTAGRVRPAMAGGRSLTAETSTLARPGKYDVLLCNSGVWMDVFSCSGSLADFDGYDDATVLDRNTQPTHNNKPARFCGRLHASHIMAACSPLARFRVTRLVCGGTIIGMTFSHLVVDGHSALAFCAAWSSEHEGLIAGKAPQPLPAVLRGSGAPVFDRDAFISAATTLPSPAEIPADVLENTSAAHIQSALLTAGIRPAAALRRVLATVARILYRKNATFTVRITDAQLKRICAAAANLEPGSSPITSNDALLGLTWATLRRCRARGVDGPPRLGLGRSQVLVQTVDLRRYLQSLPLQYFGNASWAVPLTAQAGLSDPLRLALACRASFDLFSNSTVLYDQAAALMLQEPTAEVPSAASLLPLYSDGMFSSWHAPVMWSFRFRV